MAINRLRLARKIESQQYLREQPSATISQPVIESPVVYSQASTYIEASNQAEDDRSRLRYLQHQYDTFQMRSGTPESREYDRLSLASAGPIERFDIAVGAMAGFAGGYTPSGPLSVYEEPVQVNVSRAQNSTNTTIGSRFPSNNGLFAEPQSTTLQPGLQIDRYGGASGFYASPKGTPFAGRSLPPEALSRPVNAFQVLKPIDSINTGLTVPYYGQTGLAPQYQFPKPIQTYIDSGHLKIIP